MDDVAPSESLAHMKKLGLSLEAVRVSVRGTRSARQGELIGPELLRTKQLDQENCTDTKSPHSWEAMEGDWNEFPDTTVLHDP